MTQLAAGEATHRWPQVVAGHDVVLFTVSSDSVSYDGATIRAVSLKTGASSTLIRDAYFGRYLQLDGGAGYLLFLREQTLFAVQFDPDRLELQGAPFPVLSDVAAVSGTGAAFFDFSRTGTFAYAHRPNANQGWPVVWMDSTGKTEPIIASPALYDEPRLSPDGRRLALQLRTGRSTDLFGRRHAPTLVADG